MDLDLREGHFQDGDDGDDDFQDDDDTAIISDDGNEDNDGSGHLILVSSIHQFMGKPVKKIVRSKGKKNSWKACIGTLIAAI